MSLLLRSQKSKKMQVSDHGPGTPRRKYDHVKWNFRELRFGSPLATPGSAPNGVQP